MDSVIWNHKLNGKLVSHRKWNHRLKTGIWFTILVGMSINTVSYPATFRVLWFCRPLALWMCGSSTLNQTIKKIYFCKLLNMFLIHLFATFIQHSFRGSLHTQDRVGPTYAFGCNNLNIYNLFITEIRFYLC